MNNKVIIAAFVVFVMMVVGVMYLGFTLAEPLLDRIVDVDAGSLWDRVVATIDVEGSKPLNAERKEKRLAERIVLQNQNHRGEKVSAGAWHWVSVVGTLERSKIFGHSYDDDGYGDICGVGYIYDDGYSAEGGIVQSLGKSEGRTLYVYTTSGYHVGTSCSSEVLFFG